MCLRKMVSSKGEACIEAVDWAPAQVGAQRATTRACPHTFAPTLARHKVRWYPNVRGQLELSFLWVPEAVGAEESVKIRPSGAFGAP